MQSLEALNAPSRCSDLQASRRKSNSYEESETSQFQRKLSFQTTVVTHSAASLSWEGDGSSTPKPNLRDGYFSGAFSSAPPPFLFESSAPEFRTNPHSPYGVDPPRPAREGYEWVWFPEGYWAEREALGTVRKSIATGFLFKWRSRSGKSISDPGVRRAERSSGRDTSPRTTTPRTATPYSPYASEEAHVASLQQPLGRRIMLSSELQSPSLLRVSQTPATNSEDGHTHALRTISGSSEDEKVKKPVLCIPTWRDKRKTRKPRGASRDPPSQSRPEDILSKMPDELGRCQRTSTSKSLMPFKDDANNASLVKKWFGKAPWHRKESGESASSVTSSVREVLAGKTPPTTPVSDVTGGSANQYSTSNFPGGEAKRITTPPLNDGSVTGRARAFFSETKPPKNHDDTWATDNTSTEDVTGSQAIKQHVKASNTAKEWWEVVPSSPGQRTRTGNFEFDMPEHLPSSPMCPTNAKHTSGGTGVCVYHGRRKDAASGLGLKNERREGSEVSMTEPGERGSEDSQQFL